MTGWTTKNWGPWAFTPKLLTHSVTQASVGLAAVYTTSSRNLLLLCVLGQGGPMSLLGKYTSKRVRGHWRGLIMLLAGGDAPVYQGKGA